MNFMLAASAINTQNAKKPATRAGSNCYEHCGDQWRQWIKTMRPVLIRVRKPASTSLETWREQWPLLIPKVSAISWLLIGLLVL